MTLCTGQGGTLIGVNSTTNSLALRVPVSIWAAFMVHSPRYDKLYAFCDDNLGSVTVVDCASGRVLAHIWLGRAPRWAAADPVTGKVYCTLYREDSIAVIDGAGDSLLYRRWSDERPNGVACARTATGSKVYVTVQHGANHLPVYDTRNDSLVRFVAVPDVPQHLLNGERNGVVYCSRFGAGMAAIDVALDSVVAYNATVPGAGLVSSLLFAQDLNKLYCAGGDDTIHVLDGKTLVTVHRLGHSRTTGGAGIAYSAWERKLYCALWNWSEVLVANALSDSVIDTLATGQDPELLQTATSGRILYLRNDLSRITAVDITGDTTLVHFQLPAQPVSSACSPTSRRVYYGSYSLAVFVDTATGLAEELSSASAGTPLGRTSVARGNAVLDVTEETDVFDASGRRRVVLPIGENRLVSLPAGVYYLRSRRGGASRRLVLIP
jgi:DNA-binding beta-propeller fold protein YncE